MAAGNKIQLRKADWRDFSDPNIGEVIKALKNTPYNPWIWDFLIWQEAPDTNLAEIRVDFTDEFNGEATPIILYVIGEAANEDKAAGTGARVVRIFGIDGDGNPNTEDITMHGTANTQKAGTTLWKRFVGAQVVECGTGKVNAGIIQITNTGQAAVYGTIAAGEMCTIGTRVYVPEDYNAFIGCLSGMSKVAPHATAEVVYGTGTIVAPFYFEAVNDLTLAQYWANPNIQMQNMQVHKHIVEGANTYYITMKHATKAADANDIGIYNLKIIMYGTTNSLRGLGA